MSDRARSDRLRVPDRLRLKSKAEFERVYRHGVRANAGPLHVRGMANGLDHPRLGLAVSRRMGNAVRRNRAKRLIREAFRLMQHELPGGYDLIVSVRPGTPMTLGECRSWLQSAAAEVDRKCRKKSSQSRSDDPNPDSA